MICLLGRRETAHCGLDRRKSAAAKSGAAPAGPKRSGALSEYASWGYFDSRLPGEGFEDGYQSMPVDWGISSERKRRFFDYLSEIAETAK